MSNIQAVASAAVVLARSGNLTQDQLIAAIKTFGAPKPVVTVAELPGRKRRAMKRAMRKIAAVPVIEIVSAPEPEPIVEAVEVIEELPLEELKPSEPSMLSKEDVLATFKDGGIVCLLGSEARPHGQVVKDLGRHARKHFGISATEYRTQFGLPETYPMTADAVAKFVEGF